MPVISTTKNKEIDRQMRAQHYAEVSAGRDKKNPVDKWVNDIEQKVEKDTGDK